MAELILGGIGAGVSLIQGADAAGAAKKSQDAQNKALDDQKLQDSNDLKKKTDLIKRQLSRMTNPVPYSNPDVKTSALGKTPGPYSTWLGGNP